MKRVYVVILSYKGHHDTLELLNSLKNIERDNFTLSTLIVDNFPQNPIRVDSRNYKNLGLEVIYNKKNLGFSGGNNFGINHALKNGADFIIILNNDTLVHKKFASELIKTAEEDPKIGIVVPKIYFAKGFEFHKDKYKETELGKVIWYAGGGLDWRNVLGKHRGVDEVDKGQYDKSEETKLASGCCLLIKKEILEKVGSYDERYFLYFEDADLSQRIMGVGYKIIYQPRALVWHKNAQSSGGSGSALQDYYLTRNRLLFGLKYASLRTKTALFKESIKILVIGRIWQKKGVIDFYLRKLGRGSFPI